MQDYVHEYLAKYSGPVRPWLSCADGTRMSVQASKFHYCSPRDDRGPWGCVEVWCIAGPSGRAIYPRSFGDGSKDTPYSFVPVSVVNKFIHRHGGLA
jgi:hypothetical protein